MNAGQVIPFLLSVIASGERLSAADRAQIDAALAGGVWVTKETLTAAIWGLDLDNLDASAIARRIMARLAGGDR